MAGELAIILRSLAFLPPLHIQLVSIRVKFIALYEIHVGAAFLPFGHQGLCSLHSRRRIRCQIEVVDNVGHIRHYLVSIVLSVVRTHGAVIVQSHFFDFQLLSTLSHRFSILLLSLANIESLMVPVARVIAKVTVRVRVATIRLVKLNLATWDLHNGLLEIGWTIASTNLQMSLHQ